tara:strand:+ start:1797 stop:6089 length:4293 start_codon:yes stop_codon:yes gene_type:complete
MEEFELETNTVYAGENMYENVAGYADKNQKKALVTDMSATVISQGGDLVQAVEDVSTLSAEQMKDNAALNYVQKENGRIEQAVQQVAIETPEQLPVAVNNARTSFQELDAKRKSKITPHLNWVDSLEGSEKLTQGERESIAVDSAFLQSIMEGADKRAWYETGWDILGMMAVPDESWNASEVEQQLLGDSTGLQDWLGSSDSLKNISQFRESLSSSERVMFDERLKEVITNVDDNQLQQIQLALGVLGRDEDSRNFQALEKLEAAGVAFNLGRGLLKGLRTLNVLNRTAKSGDARTAGKIADAVSEDPQVAKEAGVPQIDAATVGNPVKPEGVFSGAPDGVQLKYRQYKENVQEALDRANNVLGYVVDVDTKDADEIVAAMNRNLSKRDDIENIKTFRSKAGVTFEYDVVDGAGVTLTRETKLFELDDLGGFKQKEAGFVASTLRGVTSPNTLAGQDRDWLVQAAEATLYAKGRIGKGLGDSIDEALKPVKGNVKKLTNVSDMLALMDGKEGIPSYQRLVVEGVGGKKLTEDEFIAFTGVRKVLDDTFFLNNDVLRREMELKGTKAVDVEDGITSYAKPAGDADTAYKMFAADVDNTIIKDGDVTLKGAGLEDLKNAYKNGKVLVKSEATSPQEWFDSADGLVKYALVDKRNVSELPNIVLNRQPNYLPKLREDANWFVKGQKQIVVNGAMKNVETTLAYAATKTQANKYLAKLARAAEEAGETFDASKFDIRFDRDISKGVENSDVLTIQGGLIRGKRKSSELEWAGAFDEGGRTDALDSIQRYMGVTADRAALSEWRMEARTRIMNEAASNAEIGDKAKSLGWKSLRGEISESGMDMQRRAKLLAAYDQVNEMSNIPSSSDSRFQGWVRALGEKFDDKGYEKTAKYMYHMQDKSLVDTLKGTTFNLTLGAFAVVQIPVQLLGATVAISINPVAATKASSRWLTASTLDFVTNEKTAKAFLRKMSGDLEVDEKNLAGDYNFWRKSGMYESVVRGSADASSITNRLPYDAGVLRRGFQRAVDAGQTPYKMGELSNMRISFFTALEEAKDLAGKSFKYNDQTLQQVIARAEQFRLNMSGANKAAFQKGIWALPTQFKQIYGKYIEAIAKGSHFSPWERSKLALGQIALFGAAGVPILNHFSDEMFGLMGVDKAQLSSEELIAVKRGAIGWLFNHEMDIDALISGRLTVSADVLEDFRRALLDTNTPAIKTAFGASFTSGDKIVDLLTNTHFFGNLVIDDYLNDEELSPALKSAGEVLARSIASIPSSSRKWLAAWDLSEGMVRTSDGQPLYSVHPELGDVYARAIGFGSQEMDDLYTLRQTEVKRKEKVTAIAERYLALMYDMQNAITNQDEASVEEHQIAASFVKRHIYSLGRQDAKAVMDIVIGRLNKPRDFKEETISKAINGSLSEFTSSANKLSVIRQKYVEDKGIE